MRLLIAVLTMGSLCAQNTDDRIWSDFLAWFRTYPGPPAPPELLKAYKGKLASAGSTEAQVQQQIVVLERLAPVREHDLTGVHFDKLYSVPKHPFREDPTAFLVRMVQDLKPGRALDGGMGQGRNAVFLAGKGWDVTGYDVSEKGLAIAGEQAAKSGLKLQTVRASHEDFEFGKERWDLVVFVFSAASMSDPAFIERVRESVKPGGHVLVEQFNAPPGPGAKGPPNALPDSFRGYRVLHYEDAEDVSDWGFMRARLGRIFVERE